MLALLIGTLHCHGSGDSKLPEPLAATLGSSVHSEQELRPIISRWTLGTAGERQTLDTVLKKFVERYRGTDDDRKGDDLVVLAQVFRGFNALALLQLDDARALVRPALRGPRGNTHDLAQLVMGVAARRAGDHDEALRRLRPLLHKMLDPFATHLLNEELVSAALGAKRYAEALSFMEVWRREAEAGYEGRIDAAVAKLLAQLPRDALWAELERRRRGGLLGDGVAMATALARRLGQHALDAKDAALARLLLRDYATLLGPTAVAVARLAAERERGRVATRTVGVVMSLQNPWQRRRSAEVAAGMAFGLGLPGSGALLVSESVEEGPESAAAVLERLAAQGASVVVGGVDRASARALAVAADRAALPVLLLTPPNSTASPFVFLLGEPESQSTAALLAQLGARGMRRTAAIGNDISPLEGNAFSAYYSCDALPEAGTLRSGGIDSLLLLDGSFCFRQSLNLTKGTHLAFASGLGVAARGTLPKEQPGLSAGIFPLDPGQPDPRLRAWLRSGRKSPSWWNALGRDGAVLAWEAVKDLSAPTSDHEQVAAVRLQVTSTLAAARNTLWTSEARGFNSQRRIPRPHKGLSRGPKP